jgi:hypothetical protein
MLSTVARGCTASGRRAWPRPHRTTPRHAREGRGFFDGLASRIPRLEKRDPPSPRSGRADIRLASPWYVRGERSTLFTCTLARGCDPPSTPRSEPFSQIRRLEKRDAPHRLRSLVRCRGGKCFEPPDGFGCAGRQPRFLPSSAHCSRLRKGLDAGTASCRIGDRGSAACVDIPSYSCCRASGASWWMRGAGCATGMMRASAKCVGA